MRILAVVLVALAFAAWQTAPQVAAGPNTFVVDSTADAEDADTGDGVCES
jgi:hypothetical protein